MFKSIVALSLVSAFVTHCSKDEPGFAEERTDLVMEFRAADQQLQSAEGGGMVLQMSGTIYNVSTKASELPELRVIGRNTYDEFVFERDIALQTRNLDAGQSLVVEEALDIPANANLFEIGWAPELQPG